MSDEVSLPSLPGELGAARQLGPRRSGRLVHPGRYAGCWPRWPLSPLRWAQLSRIGRKGGRGCVSLAHYFENFCFPMVEDLVNQPPFTCFTQWLRSRGLRWDGPLVPMLASPQQRLLARTAEGQQAGALSGKAACPPLLPFGLSCARLCHCRRSSRP